MNKFHLPFLHINIILHIKNVNKDKRGAKRGQNF